MEAIACSQEEFDQFCRDVESGVMDSPAAGLEMEGGDDAAMTAKEVEEEMAATITGKMD